LEPNISTNALGAALYPEDSQVQPILAASHLLRMARELGAQLVTHAPVTALLRDGDRVTGAVTPQGTFHAANVVNTTGPWAGDIAGLAGIHVPVMPRRGFVMVTEPLPPMVHHKVYAAEDVDNVGGGGPGPGPGRGRRPGPRGPGGRGCRGADSSWGPRRPRRWCPTRCTRPSTSPTSEAGTPGSRPRPWSRALRRARS